MYADDVVLFLRPVSEELDAVQEILNRFGAISGLKTNINKCSGTPIRCAPVDIDTVRDVMPCAIAEFPCIYLGLPLSIKKPPKVVLEPLIDKVLEGCSDPSRWSRRSCQSCSNCRPHISHDGSRYPTMGD